MSKTAPEDDPAYQASHRARKAKLLKDINLATAVGVEIGALSRPFVLRSDGRIIYVDHADAATLREKYKDDPNVGTQHIVDVDAVWGVNTLSDTVKGESVDYVVASHVIEHVPDLISWLQELASILNATGQVRLLVPDKRFTFDYTRRTTALADVLPSYLVKARIPQPHSILDHTLNVRIVDGSKAWAGPLDSASLKHHFPRDIAFHWMRDVIENGTYHDVHCWVFTPRSFAQLFSEMAEAGFSNFACEDFTDTAYGEIEFYVTLKLSSDPQYVAASWQRMANKSRELPHDVERPTAPADFDPATYLELYPDVRAARMDPLDHYLTYGWKEARAYRK